MNNQDLLKNIHQIHFIGIGGSGMCPLAEILHSRGYSLSGSDNNESDNVARLRALGIPVVLGQRAENIKDADMVVYTTAIPEDNPERMEAVRRELPLIERAQLLGWITRQYTKAVAVAGTHGKTTTTSMLAQILLEADRDPSLFIGGRLPLINANGRSGQSDLFVCEACEFQDHYQAMTPAISIILNIDADHLDYFGNLENVIASFSKFAAKTTGHLIYNADDPNTQKAFASLPADIQQKGISFGLSVGCDWRAENVRALRGSYFGYDLIFRGSNLASISLGVPGEHNVLNSLAAAAAASLCGATPEEIAAGLAHFGGAGRRFELVGEAGGVTFIDDYAHHPTEISATIATAKKLTDGHLWAVFQPFTFSRTARHLKEFAEALSAADRVVVSEIMGSREQNTWQVHSSQITDRIPDAKYLATFPEIAEFVTDKVQPGDLVLTMGGGDVYKCARMMLSRYQEKKDQ